MKLIPAKSQPSDSSWQSGSLVMYEQDGSPLLAAVLGFKKDKYAVLNERGREIELPAMRMDSLPGRLPAEHTTIEAKAGFLAALHKKCAEQAGEVTLEELWSVLAGQEKDFGTKELCEIYYSSASLEQYLSLRIALIEDKIYFKRNKDTFSPRPESTVEQLKKAELNRQERERRKQITFGAFRERIADHSRPVPPEAEETIWLLERFAAGSDELEVPQLKEAKEIVDTLLHELRLSISGNKEQQAFGVLEKLGIFHKNTNLSLIRHRWPERFSDEVSAEAESLKPIGSLEDIPEDQRSKWLDLTSLDTFTVDDHTTKDMDDALSLERLPDGYRLGIHVSNVASAIVPGSALDRDARRRATSIYLPDQTIPMLHPILSEDRLSLIEGQVRPALSCLLQLDNDGHVLSSSIAPSMIRVRKRYTYDDVDELLEQGDWQLTFIHQASVELELKRNEMGAMTVHKRDLLVDVDEDGNPNLREFDEHGLARGLIGEMAVLANGLLADFTKKNNIPAVYRHQPPPEDEGASNAKEGPAGDYAQRSRLKKSGVSITPAPHSGLGLQAYAQVTSPIRRFVDLCNQRQVLSFLLNGAPLYSREEMEQVIDQTEEPLGHAIGISRETKRYWLLKYLRRRAKTQEGQIIHGTVLRSDLKNPLVELEEVFMPTLVKVNRSVHPGDVLTLRISAVDPRYDYLKLEMA